MAATFFWFINPPPNPANVREAHFYGPQPPQAGQFNDGLGIEIEVAVADQVRALAVCDGQVWSLPPLGPLASRDLVLIPSPRVASALSDSVVLGGSVVFVYRGLIPDTVRDAFLPYVERAADGPVEEMTNAARLDQFLDSVFPIYVHGGTPLGRGSLQGAWASMSFEVVFVPSLFLFGAGWARLQTLVAPGSITRRYDPVGFYAAIARLNPPAEVELDPAHVNHPLPSRLTTRALLEIRDEYDNPFVGTVGVNDGTGRVDHITDAATRGTIVLATVPPGGNPNQGNYTVSIEHNHLTSLPSGQLAATQPAVVLETPAHAAYQCVFMADVDHPRNWFLTNAQGFPRFTEGNRVEYLIDGIPTYAAMVNHLVAASGANSFVLLAGWSCDDDVEMIPGDPGTTLNALANRLAHQNAPVRGIFWMNISGTDYFLWDTVRHINQLPNGMGQAFTDGVIRNTTPLVGSHHQKCMIVRLASGHTTAFCGGIDIYRDRIDDGEHQARSPYHDVHAQIDGPAVIELFESLRRRWDTNSAAPAPLPFAAAPPPPAGSHYVQITRTYPPKMNLPFKQAGEDLGTLEVVLRAIEKAQSFIYVEDQYAFPYAGRLPFDPAKDATGIVQALLNALARPTFQAFIMVIPNHGDVPANRFRRQQFMRVLKDQFPDKVMIRYLQRQRRAVSAQGVEFSATAAADLMLDPNNANRPFDEVIRESAASGSPRYPDEVYVHSKLWIVDDVFAKIGSANANRRSMTHDSELDLHVIDGALRNGGRQFAKQFRVALWSEHFRIARQQQWAKLEDPIAALELWRLPPARSHVREYRENQEIEGPASPGRSDVLWDNGFDPEGRP